VSPVDRAVPEGLRSPGYEIFVGILSLLSIVNLVLKYAIADENLSSVLALMNFFLSGVFLIDFCLRLFTASSKSQYFFKDFGWADLLASLPFPQVNPLRLFRVVRVTRLARRYGLANVGRSLVRDRASSALFTLLLMGVFVLQFGSLWILHVEQSAEGSNITSASDAIWYVVVTISTVGYGDRFPVTDHGRVVGAAIIVVGVGIFGTFTGYLANLFLGAPKHGERNKDDEPEVVAPSPTKDLEDRVAELRALVAQQQAALADIDRQLSR
jgi:voltage-gated potassium channel Kch